MRTTLPLPKVAMAAGKGSPTDFFGVIFFSSFRTGGEEMNRRK